MKKGITILTFILALLEINANSQTLNNTTWIVYNSNNIFFEYFHFGTDTLSYSQSNSFYTPISHFAESGNTLTLIDFSGSCAADSGKYTFSIQNDTLKFILISDPCTPRITTITNYHWITFLTGIASMNALPQNQIFPNPFSEILNIWNSNNEPAEIILYDLASRKQLQQRFVNSVSLNTEQLAAGIYIYELRNKNGIVRNGKIVKE